MKNKENWEIALDKFIKQWEDKKEVIWALVCGSYVTWNPSKHSDIDVHIILDDKTSWRERGNKIIDGFLIEYFSNPINKYYKYFEENYKHREKFNAHMFYTWKIIFDKTGELKQLIKVSKDYLDKKYNKPNEIEIELDKYHIWDMYDNLEEVFESNQDDFFFVYYNDLNSLFQIYSKFLQFDMIAVHKIKRFLTNENDKKKYCIKDFPDENFVKMYIKALECKDKSKMIEEYKNLTNYVLDKIGWFNIDGWKLKTVA